MNDLKMLRGIYTYEQIRTRVDVQSFSSKMPSNVGLISVTTRPSWRYAILSLITGSGLTDI